MFVYFQLTVLGITLHNTSTRGISNGLDDKLIVTIEYKLKDDNDNVFSELNTYFMFLKALRDLYDNNK